MNRRRTSKRAFSEPEKLQQLAEAIKKARKLREWSVPELSDATGGFVSKGYIYQIEALAGGPKGKQSGKRSRGSRFTPSLDVLNRLATVLDLDPNLFRVDALLTEGAARKRALELIRQTHDALGELERGYMGLRQRQGISLTLPVTPGALTITRGDHVLFLVASDVQRLLALKVIRQFIGDGLKSTDPLEGCAVFVRDQELSTLLASEFSPFERDPSGCLIGANRKLRINPWETTETSFEDRIFSPSRAKQAFDESAAHFADLKVLDPTQGSKAVLKRPSMGRYILEDSDRFLCLLGETPREQEQRRAFLRYESDWTVEMERWSIPVQAPTLMCQYLVESSNRNEGLRHAVTGNLTFTEIIFRLLNAHDKIWFLPASATTTEILQGASAVREILKQYVMDRVSVTEYPSFWDDLRSAGIKHSVWPATSKAISVTEML